MENILQAVYNRVGQADNFFNTSVLWTTEIPFEQANGFLNCLRWYDNGDPFNASSIYDLLTVPQLSLHFNAHIDILIAVGPGLLTNSPGSSWI